MAREQKLNVDITATDKASAEITDVAKKVDKVDGKTADVKVDADTDGFSEALDGLLSKLDDLGFKTGDIAGKLGKGKAGAAGAAVALGAALFAAADHAADVAIEADNLAALTGDNVDYASRLNAVWKQTGADTKDLQDVLLQMNGVLSSNADLADTLGINLNDGATVGQRFEQVVAALDQIPDAAKRSQVASQLFGEEGVRQYTALKQAVGDIGAAIENVPDGMVISDDDVENARKTKEEFAKLKAELEGFAVTIGSVVVPAVSGLVGGLNGLMDGAEDVGRSLRRFFDEGADKNWTAVEQVEAADRAAREFDTTLLDGLRTYADVRAAALKYGTEVLDLAEAERFASQVANEWYGQNKGLADALRDKRDAADEAGTIVDAYAETNQIAALAADRLADASAREAGRLDEVKRAADKSSRAIQALDTDYQNLKRELSDEKAFITVQRAFETLGQDAADALKAGEEATLDQREALIDLKTEVGRYADEVLHLPDASITVIQALIDDGKIAEAEAQLAWLSRSRDIPLNPKVSGLGGSSYYAKGTQSAKAGLAMVGEEGPELVAFGGGEKVFTAGQTQSMLSADIGGGPVGQTVNLNINLHGATLVHSNDLGRVINEALSRHVRAGGPLNFLNARR